MAFVQFYKHFDQPVPRAQALLDSTVSEVRDQKAVHICYVYNASQLVANLRGQPGVKVSDVQIQRFVSKEIEDLAKFRREDGGFSTLLAGGPANRFELATDRPVSNADAGGLALLTRNTLHKLLGGEVPKLPAVASRHLFDSSAAADGPSSATQ